MSKRRAALLLCCALPVFAAPPKTPPQVNLRVEMRVQRQAENSAVQGSFSVGTRGGATTAAGDVTLSSQRRDADDTAQVLVLNGGSASLRIGRQVSLPTGEWYWGGKNAGFAQTRQWIDASRGFQVTPRWPGGSAPVALDINAAARGSTSLQTQVQLPLDEWTDFARSGATLLQVRVSAP
jgi:hypothetical protein